MAFISMYHAGGGQLPPNSGGDLSVAADTDFACGYAIRAGASGGTIGLGSVGSVGDSVIVGFRYKDGGGWTATNVLNFGIKESGGAANYLNFLITNSSSVIVQRNSSFGTFGGTNLGGFTIDTTVPEYWEIEWIPPASSGLLRIRLDGVTPAGWVDISGARSAQSTAVGTGYELWMDDAFGTPAFGDIVVYDDTGADWNAFVGAVTIPFLPVDASGTSDFVGDDADSTDNHLRVDAVPMGTDGYIESNTSGHRQELGTDTTSLPTTGTIMALQPVVYGLEPASGSADLDLGITEGATDSTLTTVTLGGTEQTYYGDPVFTQPDGGGDWDTTSVGNSELVLEIP